MRLSVNLNALTLEQVVSKRRKMLLDTASAMRAEVTYGFEHNEQLNCNARTARVPVGR